MIDRTGSRIAWCLLAGALACAGIGLAVEPAHVGLWVRGEAR